MTKEEKKAIKWLKELYDIEKDFNSSAGKEESNIIKTLLNLIEKQQKEIEELKFKYIARKDRTIQEIEYYKDELEKESSIWTKIEKGNDYISKDKVLKALGYEENGEEYKRIYNKEELILSLIRTINAECDRLEDIEDQKVMLEEHNIENMRDKYWQDKIKNTLLKFQNEYGEDLETTDKLFIGKEVVQYGEDMLDEIAKELDIKLLEE